MRVLYLIPDDPKKSSNPYVYSLIKAIESQSLDFVWGYGIDIIWSDECLKYDIMHVHWPHAFTHSLNSNKKKIEEFSKRIEYIINRGVKLISTCHNLVPHYNENITDNTLYNIIYSYSHYIIHLGNYSYGFLKEKYPSACHVIIPHHIYDNIYDNTLYSKGECIKTLELSQKKRYILCFGSFRHNEERNYIISIAKELRKYNIHILAPSFYRLYFRRNLFMLLLNIIRYLYYKVFYPNIHFKNKFVSDEELPIYYAASDIAFIHRLKILNSGNLPMAFLMKKVVVGPNIGNVGCILKETKNPVFNTNKKEEVICSILKGINLSDKGKGIENYIFANKNYSSTFIAKKTYNLYQSSLK